jgi:hypothetical protein
MQPAPKLQDGLWCGVGDRYSIWYFEFWMIDCVGTFDFGLGFRLKEEADCTSYSSFCIYVTYEVFLY